MNTLVRGVQIAPWSFTRLPSVKILRALIRRWRERRETERLSAYPDSMLKDIGLSRSDIVWAVRDGRSQRASSKMAGL